MQSIANLFVLFFIFICSLTAQDTLTLQLSEVIERAQQRSPSAQLAKTRLTTSRSFYRSILANYKPQITLQGVVPNVQRSNIKNTLPNGQQVFLRSASINSSLSLRLEQDVALTGGTIFAGSGLEYFYNFPFDNNEELSLYATDMIFVGFNQPLFGFNQLRWDRDIAPVRYAEATRAYAEEMESVALEAARLFFDLYSAQLNLAAMQKVKSNADSLFEISRGRFSVGRIAETDLLQIELSSMNANANLSAAILQKQTSTEALRNFFDIREAVEFQLVAPTDLPGYLLDKDKAVQLARNNRSKSFEFQRRLMEADREVAEAKGTTGFQANLFAQIGLSQNADNFPDVYKNPLDAEFITLGFQVPLADWGKAKARRDIAESNRDLERMNVEQERISVDQQVLLRVQQFDLVRQQVDLALRAYEVSQKREDITRKRYLIGKIDVSELNLALREQDEARRGYISALRSFWLAHYELRALTLYDFERERSLVGEE